MKATVIDHSRGYVTTPSETGNPLASLRAAIALHNPAAIEHRQVELHCDQEFLDACMADGEDAFAEEGGDHFSHSFEDVPVLVIEGNPTMSFGSPSAPAPPPPPPAAPLLASPSIAQSAAMEKETLASAEGGGLNGTDVTGGQGVTGKTNTTAGQKSLLGGG